MTTPRARAAVAAVLLGVSLTGCSADDDGGEPAPSPAAIEATGLPPVAEGRITRIMGDGTWNVLHGPRYFPDISISEPILLAAGPDDRLVGLQPSVPSVFTLAPDGTAETAGELGGDDPPMVFGTGPNAAVPAGDDAMLLLSGSGDEAQVGLLGLADGAFSPVATLTGGIDDAAGAAILELPGATHLQWKGTWWTLTGTVAEPAGAVPGEPPVPDILVAARTASGVSALTATELVVLDESLREVGRYPFAPPPGEVLGTVSAAAGDPAGEGLFVTTAEREAGSVLHVTPAGTTVLASGFPRRGGTPSTDCDDADVETGDARLARPGSIAVWQERLVVANRGCYSVLQLPLPPQS